MGKYDVDILVKARDAVGPGLDSAKKKIGNFEKEVRQGLGRSFADSFAKGLAAMGAVELGVGTLRALVQGLKGDFETVRETIESLPVLGGVARGVRALIDELSGEAGRLDSLKKFEENAKRINELQRQILELRAGERGKDLRRELENGDAVRELKQQLAQADRRITDLSRSLQSSPNDSTGVNALIRGSLEAGQRAQAEDQLKAARAEREQIELQLQYVREIQELQRPDPTAGGRTSFDFALTAARDAVKTSLDSMKTQADHIRLMGQIEQQNRDEWQDAIDAFERERQDAEQARQQRADAFGQFLEGQQQTAGRASLAAGAQSRFLTGAADVARDRIVTEQAKDVKASKELLTKAVTILDTIAKSPFGVKVGMF